MPDEVLSGADAVLCDGSRIVIRAKRSDVLLQTERTVIYEVAEYSPVLGYALRQVEGVFSVLLHRRKLTPFTGGTLLADSIEYVAPANPFAALAVRPFVGANMDRYYGFQQGEAKRLLERIGRIKGRDAV